MFCVSQYVCILYGCSNDITYYYYYLQEEAIRAKLKKKLEMAHVLSETLSQMPKKAKVKEGSTIEDFTKFMEKVYIILTAKLLQIET